MNSIEKFNAKRKGFTPLVFHKEWQVSTLTYMESQRLDRVDRLELHRNTDEVFLLQKGTAVLISAQLDTGFYKWQAELMQEQNVYNIPMHLWHNIVLAEDAVLYIVEKRDTHRDDVSYRSLNMQEQEYLQALVKKMCPSI